MKLKISLVAGVLIAMSCNVSSFAAINASVNDSGVNVRAENSTQSDVVAKVDEGQKVTINSSNEGFYKVSFDETENVFIAKEFIDIIGTNVIVNDDGVNVRSKPAVDGDILGQVNNGVEFIVKGIDGEWCSVDYNGSNGYIHIDFLNSVDESNVQTVSPINNATFIDPSEETYVVAESDNGLNMRVEPSTDAEIMDVIPYGTAIPVQASNQYWVQISYNGSVGYVSTEFLTIHSGPIPENNSATEAQEIIAYAEQFVGTPYVYGGTDLYNGVDCSGFVYSVFGDFGIQLNRSSRDMYNNGVPVEKADLQPADLLFFAADGTHISHVAIYIGDGQYIHSTDSKGRGVSYSNLNDDYSARTYYGARRVL